MVRNCPCPERGISCISIVDIISKIALVLFNLIRESKTHFNCCPIIGEFIRWEMIHSGLLLIVFIHSKSRGWVINILIVIFEIRNKKRYIMCYFPLNYDDQLILVRLFNTISCFIVFLTMILSVFSNIFLLHLFEAVKEWHKLWYSILINSNIKSHKITDTLKHQTPKYGAISAVRRLWLSRS